MFIVFFEIPLALMLFIMLIAAGPADIADGILYDTANTICIAAIVMFAVIGIVKVIYIIRNSRIRHLILPSVANDAALCRLIYCVLPPLLSDGAQGGFHQVAGFYPALFLAMLPIALNLLASAAILKSKTNKDSIIAYVLTAISATVCMFA